MQLANFFPALLLQSGAWRMEALVHWGRRRLRKTLQITSDHGLSSHYRDQGAWRSRAETWFEERFVALETGWCLEPGEPLDLGSQDLLVPDFTFRKQGRVAHLDIVGFWRKGYLDKRLKSVPDNVVVAVSRKLSGDKKSTLPDRVVAFSEVIPPKKVLALVEQVARKTP
jgi:hypothetical protein